VTLRESDTIDPTVFNCNKMTIKANKMKQASMQFVLGAVMKRLNKSAHMASSVSSRENSISSQDGSSAINTARDNVTNVESTFLKQKGRKQKNPLFGYRFKSFVSNQPDTEVLRIPSDLFMTFLDRSAVKKWSEKEQQMNFPPEIRLEQLTKKQRNNFYNHFVLRRFERNEVLVKADQNPEKLLMIVQGQVMLYLKDKQDPVKQARALRLTVTPGSCI